MKSKKVSYKINEPCTEDWGKMTPENQGRYCLSCTKSVVDFSTMTDEEIVAYMETHAREKVCGRLTTDQLNKSYTLPPKSGFSADLRAVALGVALFAAMPDMLHAQEPVNPKPIEADTLEPVLMGDIAPSYKHDDPAAKGKIKLTGDLSMDSIVIELLDEQGRVLGQVKPKNNGTFSCDLDWKLNPVSLRFKGENVREQTVYFEYRRSITDLQITLEELKPMIKGKVSVKH